MLIILPLAMTIIENATATTTWELQIIDGTGQKTILNYDQVTAIPETTVEAELYCYGAFVTSGQWTGVKISDLLNQVGADLNAQSIIFTALDGYTITISMETAARPDVIMAYEKDESQLAETYRLVIPMANGNMWIAMITFVTLSDGGADNVVSAATGPIININQNQFTQNSDLISQNTEQPTPKPTPNKTPSPTSTPIATILPTITVNPSNEQTAVQSILQNVLYFSIAAIFAFIILVSFIIRINRKKDNI